MFREEVNKSTLNNWKTTRFTTWNKFRIWILGGVFLIYSKSTFSNISSLSSSMSCPPTFSYLPLLQLSYTFFSTDLTFHFTYYTLLFAEWSKCSLKEHISFSQQLCQAMWIFGFWKWNENFFLVSAQYKFSYRSWSWISGRMHSFNAWSQNIILLHALLLWVISGPMKCLISITTTKYAWTNNSLKLVSITSHTFAT